MSVKFAENEPLGKALYNWWESLEKQKGERAELRRAKSIHDVLMSPAFHRACKALEEHFRAEKGWELKLAPVIGLLAHVRVPVQQRLAIQMAGNPPVVSELRFRRLIQRNEQDLYVAMIRVLRMLDKKASIPDLADSVYHWGDKVKQRWAFAYFANVPAKASA